MHLVAGHWFDDHAVPANQMSDPRDMAPEVEAWIGLALGNPACVDRLVRFLCTLDSNDQVSVGLPWVEKLVTANPERFAYPTYMLPGWLMETRSSAVDTGLSANWQRVVDPLVVAGETRLAPYSD